MSDPQHFGLGELGQRLQAMGDPAPQPMPAPAQSGGTVPSSAPVAGIDSRLRPYQGAPLPVGPLPTTSPVFAPAGQTAGSLESRFESRPTPQMPVPATGGNSYPGQPFEGLQPFSSGAGVSGPGNGIGSGSGSGLPGSQTPASSLPPASKPSAVSPWEQAAAAAPSGSSAQTKEPNPLESIAAGQPASSANTTSSSQSSLSASNAGNRNEPTSGLHRALNAVRSTIPIVQRLLPLLEGNFANAIGALMTPQHPAPPPVKVDLEPVERGLAEVRNSNRELRAQFQEQGTTLKRVEDQLERVREATDRNTLEQQELVEDLRAVGSRISTFAIIGIVLLAVSLGLNVYFLIELQHILR